MPSIWRTALVHALLCLDTAELRRLGQCQVGLGHMGPTCLLAVGCPTLGHLIHALPGRGRCDHGPRAHVSLIGREGGVWRTAAKRLYPPELGKLLAQALVDSLPASAAEGGGCEGEPVDEAALATFAVPIGSGAAAVGEWRDLDSAGLRAARRGEESWAARKAAAMEAIRSRDCLVDAACRGAKGR